MRWGSDPSVLVYSPRPVCSSCLCPCRSLLNESEFLTKMSSRVLSLVCRSPSAAFIPLWDSGDSVSRTHFGTWITLLLPRCTWAQESEKDGSQVHRSDVPMLGTESCEVLPFPLLRLHPREGLGQVPAALRCPNLPGILHCSPN